MKKLKSLVLSIISFITIVACLPLFSARAESSSETLIETETFLPSSALQLYNLNSPVSISYSNSGFMVITEHIGDDSGASLFDKISVFNPNDKKFTAVKEHETIKNVTHAQEHGGLIFYLSNSRLYYLSVDGLDGEPIETTITSSNFFYIQDNYLITNTNNSIIIYSVSVDNGVASFSKKSTHNFTTKNAFISQEQNVYYLFGGKLYCFDTTNSTSYEVTSVPVDVNYLTEYGNFIYLSSSSGIYKVEKGVNKTLNLFVKTDGTNKLGHLKNPQGLTVMDNQILVADPDIKCIQGINATTGEFTDFAITVESTADFRLTNNASKLSVSENYAYVLDDGEADGNGNVYKRIVRVSLDKNEENRYLSISLKPLYNENGEFNLKHFACSNSHIAIYAGKTLSLYKIDENGLTLEYSLDSESITSLSYLDGEFYFTDYTLKNFEYNAVNVKKITLPNEDNLQETVKVTEIEINGTIKGVAKNACVDVFGNAYIINNAEDGTLQKLIKISNGEIITIAEIDYTVISIKVDFAGNVYALSSDGKIYKYGFSNSNVSVKTYAFNASPIKDIDLNYQSEVLYALTNSCILKTVGDELDIINLNEVSARSIDLTKVETSPKFITVQKNAKLFKVQLNSYNEQGNFEKITPVSNPSPDKVYLIVQELENYYLVSYGEKFVALVSKTNVEYAPNINYSSAIITETYYKDFNVSVKNASETLYLTNDTIAFTNPIFDVNYKTQNLNKNTEVQAVKTVEFNGTKFTLIKDKNDNLLGYVVSGYLTDTKISDATIVENKIEVVSNNGQKHFNTVLMISIIALTVTLCLLFLEKKLLFDKENNDVNK